LLGIEPVLAGFCFEPEIYLKVLESVTFALMLPVLVIGKEFEELVRI
jgi:hypothetical protein